MKEQQRGSEEEYDKVCSKLTHSLGAATKGKLNGSDKVSVNGQSHGNESRRVAGQNNMIRIRESSDTAATEKHTTCRLCDV